MHSRSTSHRHRLTAITVSMCIAVLVDVLFHVSKIVPRVREKGLFSMETPSFEGFSEEPLSTDKSRSLRDSRPHFRPVVSQTVWCSSFHEIDVSQPRHRVCSLNSTARTRTPVEAIFPYAGKQRIGKSLKMEGRRTHKQDEHLEITDQTVKRRRRQRQ